MMAFREKVREWLGANSLATEADMQLLRRSLEFMHREVMDELRKSPSVVVPGPKNQRFEQPVYDWEQVERMALERMLSNPQKEDS